MQRALDAAGYEVFESSNALQLEVGLRVNALLAASDVLFVLGAGLAAQCATPIAEAARKRAGVGLPNAHVILTYEFGTLVAPALALAPCVVRGTLEKPFGLNDLQALALACRHRSSIAPGADDKSL
jgi:hypothetical protein